MKAKRKTKYLTPEFGHWLAGFIDGEGCFSILLYSRNGTVPYCGCSFAMKQRADNISIMEEIKERTGIGRLKIYHHTKWCNPCCEWIVQSKKDTQALVKILDVFPLRANKKRDYKLWRKAVKYYANMPRGNRWDGPRDYTVIARMKKELEEIRKYK